MPALITVTGSVERAVEPNLVTLTIELWSKGLTAKQAQESVAGEYKRIKKVFDQFKIKKDDVQTDNYSLNPEYIYDQKTQQNKMVGFRAVQTLKVTLHAVEEAGAFIDGLVVEAKSPNSGANVNSIYWDTDRREALQIAGLADAVKQAKIKADEIAKAAGTKIKGAYHITHHTGGATPIFEAPLMAKTMALDGARERTELSAGQVKIIVTVSIDYEIQ